MCVIIYGSFLGNSFTKKEGARVRHLIKQTIALSTDDSLEPESYVPLGWEEGVCKCE